MVEQCFYNEEDDDIDESCLQIDCNNRKTEEAMSKLSIENEKDDSKSCSQKLFNVFNDTIDLERKGHDRKRKTRSKTKDTIENEKNTIENEKDAD